jgi:hypothetical protein
VRERRCGLCRRRQVLGGAQERACQAARRAHERPGVLGQRPHGIEDRLDVRAQVADLRVLRVDAVIRVRQDDELGEDAARLEHEHRTRDDDRRPLTRAEAEPGFRQRL